MRINSLLGISLLAFLPLACTTEVVPDDALDTGEAALGQGQGDAQGSILRGAPHAHHTTSAKGDMPLQQGTTPSVTYHGGAVMTAPKKAYLIWYGSWASGAGTTRALVEEFVQNIGGSPYFRINSTYTDANNTPVSQAVSYGGSVQRGLTKGSSLSDNDIANIVEDEIDAGTWTADPNGVYFVITAPGVTQSGSSGSFCTDYCGWHTYEGYAGISMKYAFIGAGSACTSGCEWSGTTPNGNAEADTMVSTIAHELEEATTDPELDAWYGIINSKQEENADRCAWTTGTTYTAANGGAANMHLGSRDWLIQQNYIPVDFGGCDTRLSFSSPAPAHGRTTADFNGDGYADVLLRNSSTNELTMWLMFGSFPAQQTIISTNTQSWQIYGLGDFNGDKKSDIAWRNLATGQVSVWMMNGTTETSAVHVDGANLTNQVIVGIGDFDGDGKAQLLFRGYGTANVRTLEPGSGQVTPTNIIDSNGVALTASTTSQVLGTGDFNGDGKSDILWQSKSTGDLWLWLMDGNSRTGNVTIATGTGRVVAGIGDVNGDGTDDIIYTLGSGTSVYRMLMKNGAILSDAFMGSISANSWRVEEVADFNGDGQAEVFWRDRQSGTAGVWYLDANASNPTWSQSQANVNQKLEVIRD
jgi:hypothetical protein